MKRKKTNYSVSARAKAKRLTADQIRFNKSATKKGAPGSTPWKRYVFGHRTNVQKGR